MSNEAIHAQAEAAAAGEHAVWERFASDSSTAGFSASWLAILCAQVAQVGRVGGALLVLGPDAAGGYGAAAVWPDMSRNMQYLGAAAERALNERRGFVEHVRKERRRASRSVIQERRRTVQGGLKAAFVAYPIEVAGQLYGAVVLDIENAAPNRLQQALRLVHWGSAWLVDRFRQQQLGEQRAVAARLATAAEVAATALQQPRLRASALAVANELAARLGCERVGLGLEVRGNIVVQAISHSASFDPRTDLVRLMGEAMEEVLDLDMALVHPALDKDEVGGLAHAALSAMRGDASVMSVPLVDDGTAIGAMTFERARDKPFGAAELELCKALGLLLGPILALKRAGERSLRERAAGALGRAGGMLFGPRHPGLKLGAFAAVLALAVLGLVNGDYRVTARTVIEGAVQRAMAAPFQGYVAQGFVRAGERVRAGQPMARLDDRELRLERTRWVSEAEQARRKYLQAAAQQERAAMAVAAAQTEQAEAQLALVDERLARATLRAPFDGIVVFGDLSQQLGSPVEQGKVLFEVAPLDAYRVVLNVDERDIDHVRQGQRGELALAGLPYERLAFTVRQVTPVASAQDGHNTFRVEARLDQASLRLRPGMEGIGKVEAGKRKLAWIWMHPLIDWIRMWTWKWLW